MYSLEMEKIFFEKIKYERKDFCAENEKINVEYKCDYLKNKDYNNKFKVSFNLICKQGNDFIIEITVSGIFLFNFETNEELKLCLDKSIKTLFPYIRVQLSLLTSQPNMKTITLPIMEFE